MRGGKWILQFPVGHFLVGDMVVQYDRGVFQGCRDKFIVD